MLSFLNISAKYVFLIPAIVIVWTLLIGGPVDSLPFGTQTTVSFIGSTFQYIIDIMPFMSPLFDILVWGIQIKIFLLIVWLIQFIISIFVQS